jgi:hypothetical protein
MSALLYAEAVHIYKQLFGPTSAFWGQLDQRMKEWHAATIAAGVSEADRLPRDPTSRTPLAQRGAPLKISAFAVCMLSGRLEQFPVIERCLDHALTAMVLYDHAVDWRADLAAGRWNAFVASALPSQGTRATSAEMQVAMLTTDAIAAHFAAIVEELNLASAVASDLSVHGLFVHLSRLADHIDAQGAGFAARYREIAEEGHQLLFGNRPRLAA